MKATKIAIAAAAIALSQATFAASPVDQYLIDAGFQSAPAAHREIRGFSAAQPADTLDRFLVENGYQLPAESGLFCKVTTASTGALDAATHYLIDSGFEDAPTVAAVESVQAARSC